MASIYAGKGGTVPGERIDGSRVWHDTKVFIRPLIDGISERLWIKIYNETCERKPMYGHDGSAVFYDGEWSIIRRMPNGKEVEIATLTEVG